MKKTFSIILLIILSAIITKISVQVPINGMQIQHLVTCGEAAGLPFSFVGTWRDAGIRPPCVIIKPKGLSLSFILDVVFWFFVSYFLFKLIRKIFKKRQEIPDR